MNATIRITLDSWTADLIREATGYRPDGDTCWAELDYAEHHADVQLERFGLPEATQAQQQAMARALLAAATRLVERLGAPNHDLRILEEAAHA